MPTPLDAAAFTGLRLRYGADPQPGELPAAIEHAFGDGRMVDHYLATPAPALLAQAALRTLGQVGGVVFVQAPQGGDWAVRFLAAEGKAQAEFAMPEQAFRELLAANGTALPGEPSFVPPAAPAP